MTGTLATKRATPGIIARRTFLIFTEKLSPKVAKERGCGVKWSSLQPARGSYSAGKNTRQRRPQEESRGSVQGSEDPGGGPDRLSGRPPRRRRQPHHRSPAGRRDRPGHHPGDAPRGGRGGGASLRRRPQHLLVPPLCRPGGTSPLRQRVPRRDGGGHPAPARRHQGPLHHPGGGGDPRLPPLRPPAIPFRRLRQMRPRRRRDRAFPLHQRPGSGNSCSSMPACGRSAISKASPPPTSTPTR